MEDISACQYYNQAARSGWLKEIITCESYSYWFPRYLHPWR